MRPAIGITLACERSEAPLAATASIHLRYLDAITAAGGRPVPIPPLDDATLLAEAIAGLAGLCFIGGPDYLPESYGGHPQPGHELIDPRRHRVDLALARTALAGDLPLLGVCGGMQLLVIASGGALVQDIATEWPHGTPLPHAPAARPDAPPPAAWRHSVRLEPGSRLARAAGATALATNSYHHQAVDPRRLGGLRPVGWTDDGVIEVVEGAGDRFVLGVQWHPERQPGEPAGDAVFAAFLAACR